MGPPSEKWAVMLSAIFLVGAGAIYIWTYFDRMREQSVDLGEDRVATIPEVLPSPRTNRLIGEDVNNKPELGTEIIKFPDGEEFTIKFVEPYPPPPPNYTSRYLSEMYHELVAKAEDGDAAAASVLHQKLFSCKGVYYRTDEQYSEGRRDILDTGTYKSYDHFNGELIVHQVGSSEGALEMFESTFQSCQGVSEEMLSEVEHWQELAADLGDPRHKRSYAMTREGNTAVGRELLKEVFMNGQYMVGRDLGEYLIGQDNPYILRDGVEPIDDWQFRVDGFAYYYLATTLAHADRSYLPQRQERLHRAFNRAVGQMSSSEQAAGVERAKQILGSYSQCCRSSSPYADLEQQ